MGLFEEAAAVRTRALDAAKQPVRRWEAYHYRWRLYYWLGELDAARADLDELVGFDPDNIAYKYAYPALLAAERGELEAGREIARSLDRERSGAEAVLWSATCLRLLGCAEEARALLAERLESMDFNAGLVPPQGPVWLAALYAACMDGGDLADLEELTVGVATPWKLMGEAAFHHGRRAAGSGGWGRILAVV